MNLAYRLAHPVIESGADAEATVLVTITAPLGKIARRPVNLAVALDRSGSMAGEPLAIAKTALKQFVDQLLPTDRADDRCIRRYGVTDHRRANGDR